MHTKPVAEINKWHNIKLHCYAYDTKVCMTLKTFDKWDAISFSIEVYIEDKYLYVQQHAKIEQNKDKT